MIVRTSLCFLASVVSLALLPACSSTKTEDAAADTDSRAVVKSYATIVRASYADTVSRTTKLKTAVDALVASPSQATLDAARAAWLEARPVYGQTEAYRFYGGPIDAEETGPEGRINAWPIDENFIDATRDQASAGIINRPDEFPSITRALLADQNEKGGEKNISSGWHAIEFLLWGQDFDPKGPGQRPFADYVAGGAAKNADRRGAYLKAATELLLEDLVSVEAEWDESKAESYAAKMVAGDPKKALSDILKGLGSLATSELPLERMNNAYQTKEQEEEHSCFSDTTHLDLYNNALGIENVYLGRFGALDGKGIDDLVRAKDAALDAKMKERLKAALDAIKAIPAPFDAAILGDDTSDGRKRVKAAIDASKAVGTTVVEVATALGITINIE